MKYSRADLGRVFVIRLEDGEILHEEIEKFAEEHSIKSAALFVVGAVDKGSTLIVGPEQRRSAVINPMEYILNDTFECTGTGTIFPDDNGKAVLHMHIAAGRNNETITGCVNKGIFTWHILEIIFFEIKNTTAKRVFDNKTGFKLLVP